MEIKEDLLGKLARTGSLASFFGLVEQAQTILKGIRAIRPSNLDVLTSLAITKMNAGYPAEAIEIFENHVLRVEPENWTAKCFLGLALKQLHRNYHGDNVLYQVIAAIADKKHPISIMADDFLKSR